MISGPDPFTVRMLGLARDRGTVLVAVGPTEVEATLVYWRNRRARVEYQSGRRATIDTALVRPLPKGHT